MNFCYIIVIVDGEKIMCLGSLWTSLKPVAPLVLDHLRSLRRGGGVRGERGGIGKSVIKRTFSFLFLGKISMQETCLCS